VTVADSGGPSPADDAVPLNASITVIDDVPEAQSNTHEVTEGVPPTVDIQFIVDMSGSMFTSVGFEVPDFANDRAGLARYSMLQMLQNNDQIQNVEFVQFGTSATGSAWMTKADAIAFLQNDENWTNLGTTNYDLALQTAISNFGGEKPLDDADQTFIYFLSDGAPNAGGIEPGAATPPGDGVITITDWENHLTAQEVDQVFAIGIGSGVTTANLSPISYPNDDGPDADTLEDRVIVINATNVNVLLDTFENFLGTPSSVISGNILHNDPLTSTGADNFGADGGYILSISIDGTTYTYDPAGNDISSSSGQPPAQDTPILTVTTALGGTLTFHFADSDSGSAGSWTYSTGSAGPESFAYAIVDGDGDQATASLDITVLPAGDIQVITDFSFTAGEMMLSQALMLFDGQNPADPPGSKDGDLSAFRIDGSVADFVVGDDAVNLDDLFETVATGPSTNAGGTPAPRTESWSVSVEPTESSPLYHPDHDTDHQQQS
jgi:hypothetical protein